jgi:hypothetical protein
MRIQLFTAPAHRALVCAGPRAEQCLSFSSVPGSEFISEQEIRAENPIKFSWFCGGATL